MVFFILPSLSVKCQYSQQCHACPYWKVKNRSCVSYLQVTCLPSLLSDSCRNLYDFYRTQKRQIQCHRVIVPQTFSTQLLPIINQALTMHFDGQWLGGVVWCSHIFVVGHTAVGPLIETSCTGDRQQETFCSPLNFH